MIDVLLQVEIPMLIASCEFRFGSKAAEEANAHRRPVYRLTADVTMM
jgi:hypothetical protein